MAVLHSTPEGSTSAHDGDVHAWARLQEAALLEARFVDLDLPHLAQEVAALGKSEYRALESALLRLLQHLLKWDHQPVRRCRSWYFTIEVQRQDVERALRDNPSLVGRRSEAMQSAYRKGRVAMLRETSLPKTSIPETSPYSWDEAMTRPIVWPAP